MLIAGQESGLIQAVFLPKRDRTLTKRAVIRLIERTHSRPHCAMAGLYSD